MGASEAVGCAAFAGPDLEGPGADEAVGFAVAEVPKLDLDTLLRGGLVASFAVILLGGAGFGARANMPGGALFSDIARLWCRIYVAEVFPSCVEARDVSKEKVK